MNIYCIFICIYGYLFILLHAVSEYLFMSMHTKNEKLAALKVLISSAELGSQEEVLQAMAQQGYSIPQASLSRYLKQLGVTKQSVQSGKNIYVLPQHAGYRRIHRPVPIFEGQQTEGFISLRFSGNMGVIRTKPGHAGSIAYKIDSADLEELLGTIAGDDTIFLVTNEDFTQEEVIAGIGSVIPDVYKQGI